VKKVRIWYDALTGKHVRYGTALAKRFRQQGHDIILTTRKHPDTVELAKILKEEFLVIGDYDPTSLHTRLQASLKRMLKLSELFEDTIPDVAICSQSVDLCRVAFGLGIPIFLTADTAYAVAVNKLTLPLANTVITSEALPKRLFKNFGAQNIVQFNGVDEAAWIKDFKPSGRLDFKKPVIVVRQMETKATYARGKEDATKRIAQKLSSFGTVLFLPRYDKQQSRNYIVVREFVDSASLVAHADLVLGVGGTISREAVLQGVPSIAISQFGRIHVNEYLARKGFPIFITPPSKALALAKKYLGKKWDVKAKLRELENPVDVIEKLATKRQTERHCTPRKSEEED
jgi:predicted glycosyltransferase